MSNLVKRVISGVAIAGAIFIILINPSESWILDLIAVMLAFAAGMVGANVKGQLLPNKETGRLTSIT